ncbi:MAG TPA: aldehyde dehydrogenase family protein [Chthoniobacterales bacterium]|nr:aldehyde dehydrogenase family protein [Chthoniobacterales bacterium]
MKPVLLLVDLQHDFLRANNLEPHSASVIAAAATLLAACRQATIPVIHVWTTVDKFEDNRMPHRKKDSQRRCLEGSAGHACPEPLRPRKAETVIHKTFFSAFSTGQLEAVLEKLKVDTIIIAGMHLHACVRATSIDAYAKNYRVVVAEDATASDDPLHGAITKRYLQERSVTFCETNEIANALSKESGAVQLLLAGDRPEMIAHCSPHRAEKSWRCPPASKAMIANAVVAGREALTPWRAVQIDERLKLLHAFGRHLQEHRDEMVELLVEQIGKPIRYARQEVARALDLVDAADWQTDEEQDRLPAQTGYRREPLGLIALIAPFNNPLAIPVGKIVPALIYGNVVVWKPAIAGLRIAQKTAELFAEATKRPELLQVLAGGDQTASQLMAECDAVTISGSLKAGRSAQEVCGVRHISLQAELGGNNASIVWRDADLSGAAASIAEGAFAFAGQRCTANRRVIVEASVSAHFLQELIAASGRLVWGDPGNEQTQIGPLISCASRNRVAHTIDRAEKSRHRVIRPLPDSQTLRGGAWLSPAIICCDDPTDELVQEETFGPVLVVQRAKDWDDAISLCNGVKQGLVAALFSTSKISIQDFLRRARAGVLKINKSTADVAVGLPFGGWKASGIGPAEHGRANREFFTRMQAIYF